MKLMPDSYRCKSPVALFIFNRPETTERVFAEIVSVRPRQLLVVADGPRPDRSGEDERCNAAKRIIDRVDWDCEVLTNYSTVNLGCRRRVSSGIDWVFDNVNEAIFLEDDCLPHPSFFRFCDEMLERHRNDERIMVINGANFQFGHRRCDYSYYFSRYVHVWGWASWRRAWKFYDVNMSQWPVIRQGGWLEDILGNRGDVNYWTWIFDRVHQQEIDTWDYQWVLACWLQSGLSVSPNVNLVSNIGFSPGATHTGQKSKTAELPTREMPFPLKHPEIVIRDARADRSTAALFFRKSLLSRAIVAMKG